MADIEQGKPQNQAVEYMETSSKDEAQPVTVSAADQKRICRKVNTPTSCHCGDPTLTRRCSLTRGCSRLCVCYTSSHTSIVATSVMQGLPASRTTCISATPTGLGSSKSSTSPMFASNLHSSSGKFYLHTYMSQYYAFCKWNRSYGHVRQYADARLAGV
jgi:hypothetical protein